MSYTEQLEKKIEQLEEALANTEKQRDTFQELLDNVIKEVHIRFCEKQETEMFDPHTIQNSKTAAVSKKYISEKLGIDLEKEYDRIFNESTTKENS